MTKKAKKSFSKISFYIYFAVIIKLSMKIQKQTVKRKLRKKTNNNRGALSNDYYQVDEVLETRRKHDGSIWCLVSWKGYGPQDNSWVRQQTVL